jgi:hypothetical protein
MCERVNRSTDLDVQLWSVAYSPAFGSISWTAFLPDLVALEAAGDKLAADDGYIESANRGAELTIGGIDDSLLELVHGAPDPNANPQYVSVVQAVCAAGSIVKGMTVGVEFAQRAEAITGRSTMFVRSVTGPYAGVAWITGYSDAAELEAAQNALAADADWLTFLDARIAGTYIEDVASTQTAFWRKMA